LHSKRRHHKPTEPPARRFPPYIQSFSLQEAQNPQPSGKRPVILFAALLTMPQNPILRWFTNFRNLRRHGFFVDSLRSVFRHRPCAKGEQYSVSRSPVLGEIDSRASVVNVEPDVGRIATLGCGPRGRPSRDRKKEITFALTEEVASTLSHSTTFHFSYASVHPERITS
jgi:hypothetical protein